MVNTVLTISGEAEAVVEIIKRLAFNGTGTGTGAGTAAALAPAAVAFPAQQPPEAAPAAPAAESPPPPAGPELPRWNPDLVRRILSRVTEPSRWMIERMLTQPNYIIDIGEVSERLQMSRRSIGGIKRSIGAAQTQLAAELPPVVIVYGRNRMGLNEDFAAAMTKLKQPPPPAPSRLAQWEQLTAE